MAKQPGRTSALYGFSTAHVQLYVVATSRLRDIDGASQRLESLCGEVFDEALSAVGLDEEARSRQVVSQAAGGARIVFTDHSRAEMLYAIWPMIADRYAPGVFVEQAIVTFDPDVRGAFRDANGRLGELLRASRSSQSVELPLAGPMTHRSGRTGRAAVGMRRMTGDGRRDLGREELIDRPTWGKEIAHRAIQTGHAGTLARRFLGVAPGYRFADARLGSEQAPYIALIHADGNGIGRFITQMAAASKGGDDQTPFKAFSKQLKDSTEAAARAATGVLMEQLRMAPGGETHTLPARPIILGGDDVTIAVEARFAIPFVEAFLTEFARDTARWVGRFGVRGTRHLTASAGIAVIKHNFPYDRGHALAESLCQQAKAWSKRHGGVATLSMHRVTTALPETAEVVLANELTVSRSGEAPPGFINADRLTFEAYRVGAGQPGAEPDELASLDGLKALADALPYGSSRGQVRNLLAALHDDPAQADASYARLIEVLRSRGPAGAAQVVAIERALTTLNGAPRPWRANSQPKDGQPMQPRRSTPLLDAFTVRLLCDVREDGR